MLNFQRKKFYRETKDNIYNNTNPNPVAFMQSFNDVLNFNKKNKDSMTLKTCKQFVSSYSIVLYLPKNFYLIEAINDVISKLSSSGIMSHIIDRYYELRYWNIKVSDKGPQKLTMQNLQGSFYLLLILCSLSVPIFMIEFFVARTRF